MKNYQKLVKIIQEANPEIKKREKLYRCNRVWEAWQYKTMTEDDFEEVDLSENIRLADVLLAVKQKEGVWHKWIDGSIQFKKTIGGLIGEDWNLKDNNLDNQSSETKKFLIDLLIKEQKGRS